MPWDPEYRKQGVQGITANAIDVVIETGDSGPVTPVGINLPNDQTIRERYGSKSVSLSNVSEAYDKSTLPEFRSEFSWTPEETARATKWSAFAGELTTNMHEVIGHASGKVEERLKGNPAGAVEGAVLGARRRDGPTSSRCISCRIRSWPRSASWSAGGSGRDRPHRIRSPTPATRSSSCAGFARARKSKKTTCATAR